MGFDQHEGRRSITGINVTPLVDITLVLLIIFMVTTTYIVDPSLKVDLPKASTGDDTRPSTLSLVLTQEGVLYLNGQKSSETALDEFVTREISDNPDLQAVISADTQLRYGRVVRLIDQIKKLGVRKYALNIKYVDAPRPAAEEPSLQEPPEDVRETPAQ